MSGAVKCVVWDLDGTVWPGIAIELPAGQPIEPRPEALRAMDVLAERGIVNSLASRSDPDVGRLVSGQPALAGRFVAPQIGWGHKSDAIVRIADDLGISLESIAFVDDSPFERAEVAAVLPDVRVLAPDELLARLDSAEFRPGPVTEDARQRVSRYHEEQLRRRVERKFAGRREDFLQASDVRLRIRPGRPSDVERIVELLERTHRFNTTGEPWSLPRVRAAVDDPGWQITVASLRDRYGRYGLIGVALIERPVVERPVVERPVVERPVVERPGDATARWRLRMLAVSCRAAGRDVPIALLSRVMAAARAGGATRLQVDLRDTGANLELRMLLRRSGFRAAAPAGSESAGSGAAAGSAGSDPAASGPVLLTRPLTGELPAVPAWLHLDEEPDAPR